MADVNEDVVVQTWFVLHETWHTILFGIYYCVEVVRIVNHCHILNITWWDSLMLLRLRNCY